MTRFFLIYFVYLSLHKKLYNLSFFVTELVYDCCTKIEIDIYLKFGKKEKF